MNKKILSAIIIVLIVSVVGIIAYYMLNTQGSSAKGTLVVMSGVSGVTVTILGPEETLKTGITNQNGDITFTDLPEGTYVGIATKEGYVPHTILSVSVTKGRSSSLPITMTSDDIGPYSNPAALIIKQGSTGTTTVTLPSAGFTGDVSLSCEQLPSGVTATLNPESVTIPEGGKATLTLTLTASSTATKGTYTSIMIKMSNEEGSISGVFGLLLQVS